MIQQYSVRSLKFETFYNLNLLYTSLQLYHPDLSCLSFALHDAVWLLLFSNKTLTSSPSSCISSEFELHAARLCLLSSDVPNTIGCTVYLGNILNMSEYKASQHLLKFACKKKQQQKNINSFCGPEVLQQAIPLTRQGDRTRHQ